MFTACPVGQWACPTPKRNRVTCIDQSNLCDYHIDCPKGDDEDPVQCAFYRQVSTTTHCSLHPEQLFSTDDDLLSH